MPAVLAALSASLQKRPNQVVMEDRVCLCQHRAQHRGQKEEQEERREERREETQGSGWHRNCFWGFTYANALSEDNDDRLIPKIRASMNFAP